MEKIIKTLLAEWKGKKIPDVIPRETNVRDYLNIKINKINSYQGQM